MKIQPFELIELIEPFEHFFARSFFCFAQSSQRIKDAKGLKQEGTKFFLTRRHEENPFLKP